MFLDYLKGTFYLNRATTGLRFYIEFTIFSALTISSLFLYLALPEVIYLALTIITGLITLYLLIKRIYNVDWKEMFSLGNTPFFVIFVIFLIDFIVDFRPSKIFSKFISLLMFVKPKDEYIMTTPEYKKFKKEQDDLFEQRKKALDEINQMPIAEGTIEKAPK
tara:strand:- start:245 stop:733 length:489 start_codon:yes stop_codon:yes gene_type:complete